MSDRKSSMLPTSSQFVMPSLDMKTSGQRLYENQHSDATNRAFADAFVANFPQGPAAKRDGLVRVLVEQGMPFDQAEAQADEMLAAQAPAAPAAGSRMLPTSMPDPRASLGRVGDDGVKDDRLIHANAAEEALLKALGGAGTINPRTKLPEYRYDRADTKAAGTSGTGGGDRGRSGSTGGAGGGSGGGDPRAVDRIAQTMNNVTETHQLKDWADATREFNDRSFGRRVLDFFAGPWFNDNKPDFNKPETFWGGQFHTSTNPLGAAASLAGFAFPGAGIPAGMVGSAIGPEVFHKNMDPNSPLAHELASANPLGPSSQPSAPGVDSGNPMSPGSPTRAGQGSLLPPIVGNPAAQAQAVPAPIAPGAPLLPTRTQQQAPAGVFDIPGPSPYSWRRPSWAF